MQLQVAHGHTLPPLRGHVTLWSLPVAMLLVLLYYYHSNKKARETEKKVWEKSTKKKYAKIKVREKKYAKKSMGKKYGITCGSPIGHAEWYLYYSTKCVKKWRHRRKNAGENDVIEKKCGENDVTSDHVTDVTFDQGRSLPVAPPPQIIICLCPYTTRKPKKSLFSKRKRAITQDQ